jgi:hypothetical protein
MAAPNDRLFLADPVAYNSASEVIISRSAIIIVIVQSDKLRENNYYELLVKEKQYVITVR